MSTSDFTESKNESVRWRDPSVAIEERLDDLLSRLTLEEKITQLDDESPAVERIGLPAFRYGGEALHGLCNTGRATIFPMPIGLAATFNPELIEKIASATGDEMRAKHHAPQWSDSPRVSLLVYSPVINILRDPRWGRAQETYGEDPFLTGQMGAAFIRGIQGDHPRYLKIAGCAKHLGVHSGPEAQRTRFNAVVSPRDLRETYLPAFTDLIRAGAASVMATYNRVNGEHSCAHSEMIGQFLRRELGFEGIILSDGGALASLHRKQQGETLRLHHQFAGEADADGHNLTEDLVETAGLCLREQCDLEMGRHAYRLARQAIERGLISEAEVDRAVRRILRIRFKLGVFDPPEANPYTEIPASVIQCEEHLQLSLQAARESIVLLKNESAALPLQEKRDRVVLVTGPTSVDLQILMGNFYKGISGRLVSLLEGITTKAPEGVNVTHSQGCFTAHPNVFESEWYLGLTEWCDTVVACVGLSPLMEGEQGECIGAPDGGDKTSIALPEHQLRFLRSLRERIDQCERPQRLVVVVTGGCQLELSEVQDLADALVMAWYPGEQGGVALGEVLWGEADPAGRLPVTFPEKLADLPPFESYAMQGRTYRYATHRALYPFGYGLSFTCFKQSTVNIETTDTGATLHTAVENTGKRTGSTVVQVYARWPEIPDGPQSTLVGFQRLEIEAGATRTASVSIPLEKLRPFNNEGRRVSGQFSVELAACPAAPVANAAGSPAEADWKGLQLG